MQRLGLPVFVVLDMPEERIALLGTKFRKDGRRCCVALQGDVGGRCGCRIYADRPALCREFEAGSPECLQARTAAGLTRD